MSTRLGKIKKHLFSREVISPDQCMMGYMRLMARTTQINSAQNLFHSFIRNEARRLSSLRPSSSCAAESQATAKH